MPFECPRRFCYYSAVTSDCHHGGMRSHAIGYSPPNRVRKLLEDNPATLVSSVYAPCRLLVRKDRVLAAKSYFGTY